MADFAIRTEGLTKVYSTDFWKKGVLGLDDLNLEVETGSVFAFIGPNGAGKTTAIKLLTQLIFPSQGKIWVMGVPSTSRLSMKKIGFLPEQPRMYGYLSGREFLDFIARIFGLDPRIRKKKISELLAKVGLGSRGNMLIRKYSRGMMQRLGLAQAIINDPELLILDEPMASLDPLGRKDFRDLILDLKAQGKSIFFSSHILSDAEMVADRVGILNRGKLIQVGNLDDIVHAHVSGVEITFDLNKKKLEGIDLGKWQAMVQDQRVMVRIEEKGVTDFLRRIDGWGGTVVSVQPQKKSLEEIFMAELRR
jgi:ABC-2 type transport system ATP-binding protein